MEMAIKTIGADAEVREKAIRHFFGRTLREVREASDAR